MRAALLFASLSAALAAHATTVEMLSLEQMKTRSDVIARMKVIDQRIVDEGDRVITYSTLLVTSPLKGAAAGDELLLYQPGALGSSARNARWMLGAHAFKKGDDVVVFAKRHVHRGQPVVILLSIGSGTFAVSPNGVQEEIGDVVNVHTHAAPIARTFASWTAMKEALK